MNNKELLYAKLEKYVKINTPSDEANVSKTPSTPSQMKLAKILAGELKALGLKNVTVTPHAYAFGELPSNCSKKMPSIGFIAHIDTVKEFTDKPINPQLHKKYNGGKLLINAAKKIYLDPKSDKLLNLAKGHDIVSSDGQTILGADDKAGVAVIMTMLEYFKNNPSAKHGGIFVAFTPDEEIAHGCELLPLNKFKADFAYTIDGSIGGVCNGNFNGDTAVVEITGVSTHPGLAKDIMISPVILAGEFLCSWPKKHRPEHTDKEKGFVHFNEISGGIEKVTLKAIVREHDLKKLHQLESELKALAQTLEKKHKGAKVDVKIIESYRNMKDILQKHPAAMKALLAAMKKENVKYKIMQARGGTDGARLTFRGLPTPDISAGYSGEHGPLEWVSLDVMESTLGICISIVSAK